MELVERHKPASYGIGAVLAAVVGWWALGGDSGKFDDEDYGYGPPISPEELEARLAEPGEDEICHVGGG